MNPTSPRSFLSCTICVLFYSPTLEEINFPFVLYTELVSDGSRLLVSLVRWFRRSQNVRPDRLPTMSKGDVDFGSEVLHRIIGSVRIGKVMRFIFLTKNNRIEITSLINPNEIPIVRSANWTILNFIGTGSHGYLLHGVGATEMNIQGWLFQ